MSSNISNNVPYLRVQRKFPQEPQELSVELERAYIDIANCVNKRGIGIFAEGNNIINGETWNLGQNTYQAVRRLYSIVATGNTPHYIDTSTIFGFVKIYGTFKSGTTTYPLPYVDSTAANNQVSVSVTATNIVITPGAGSPPTFDSGIVILEWLVQV